MMSNNNKNNKNTNSSKDMVLFSWEVPPKGVEEWPTTPQEMALLLDRLPVELSQHIQTMFTREQLRHLVEIYLQRGQFPECIFAVEGTDSGKIRHRILDHRCTEHEINIFAAFFQDNIVRNEKGGDEKLSSKRKGISGTIHRVSLITDPSKTPEQALGVTVRVGRAMTGLIQTMTSGTNFFAPLIQKRQSLLLIGRPGVGKSTALREIAFLLSNDPKLIVVVVDKSKELAGDGETPHPAIGNARWLPVGKRDHQHEIMLEAVENQSPDIVIVDELSNPKEVYAAQTIAQRGIMLIATAHGSTLPELVHDRERTALVGAIASVTLSGREANERRDGQKQVLKRSKEPVFQVALELRSKKEWIFHSNVKASVDSYLDNEPSYALRLQPGRAVRTTCLPTDGMFEYSEDGDNTVHTNNNNNNNNITNTVAAKKNKKSKNPFENYNKENNKPRQSSASASSSRKRNNNNNNNNPNTIFSSR